MPPSSTEPIPLDFEDDPDDPEFVQERSIEFLVMAQKQHQPTSGLFFLEQEELQKLKNDHEHVQLMDTVSWIRVEKATEISSMMMSTLNFRLFKKICHAIVCAYRMGRLLHRDVRKSRVCEEVRSNYVNAA